MAGYSPDDIAAMGSKETVELYSREFEVQILDANNQAVNRDELEKRMKTIGYSDESLNELMTFELLDIFNSKLPLLATRSGQTKEEYDPGYKLIFRYKPEGALKAYILPISGKGLWGMIYGYIALDTDLATVKGIRFYKHQETPGLGGEIEKPWFTSQFEGKRILDTDGKFTSISIVKGKASIKYEGEKLTHYVDGISGATITGKSVNKFLESDLRKFEPYFQRLRDGSTVLEPQTEGESR